MAGSIIEVTDDSFQAEVLESETPILVDFWAPWCAPCRAIAPLLEEIAAGREDVRIVKLNVDENQITAAQYQILSIPSLVLFNNGAETKRLRPTRSKSQLEDQLELEPAA
jgi:thioredoxin 1